MTMTTNVLILCTHNSARSVLAEGVLNHLGEGPGKDVRAYSAGSAPSGRVNPFALEALAATPASTSGLRSKSWDEFAGPAAPRMRIVITVCDSAAAEQCPFWPGSPAKAHWGYADPSFAPGATTEALGPFQQTLQAIADRMEQLVQLPPSSTLAKKTCPTALDCPGR